MNYVEKEGEKERDSKGERWLDFNFESENNISSNKMLRNIFQPRLPKVPVHMLSLCSHQLLAKCAMLYLEAMRVYRGASGIWNKEMAGGKVSWAIRVIY